MALRVTQCALEILYPFSCDFTPDISYRIEIDSVDNTFQNLTFSGTQRILRSFRVADDDFFNPRWFRVTPVDVLGDGIAMIFFHQYSALAPASGVTQPVLPPPTANTFVVPPAVSDYSTDYAKLTQDTYAMLQ